MSDVKLTKNTKLGCLGQNRLEKAQIGVKKNLSKVSKVQKLVFG